MSLTYERDAPMHLHLTPSSEGTSCPACSHAKLVRIDTVSTRSRRGDPMAVVACPLCNWREGWVRNNLTGQMMRLWNGRAPNESQCSSVGTTSGSSPYAKL